MGKLEESNKKRVRRGEIQKLILNSVKIAGVLSIGLVAPQVIGAMGKLGLLPNKRQEEIVRSSASKLVKKCLLIYQNGRFELTEVGEKKLRHWELEDYKFKRPHKWDKKWRVVIFRSQPKEKHVTKFAVSLFRLASIVCKIVSGFIHMIVRTLWDF